MWAHLAIFTSIRYTEKESLLEAILRLPYPGGKRDTAGGLHQMRTKCFNVEGDRPNVTNKAIVITNGIATDPSAVPQEIAAVHDSGIDTYAVGVTDQVDEATLKNLSSQPQQVLNLFNTYRRQNLLDVSFNFNYNHSKIHFSSVSLIFIWLFLNISIIHWNQMFNVDYCRIISLNRSHLIANIYTDVGNLVSCRKIPSTSWLLTTACSDQFLF